jgi:hypothetical protein
MNLFIYLFIFYHLYSLVHEDIIQDVDISPRESSSPRVANPSSTTITLPNSTTKQNILKIHKTKQPLIKKTTPQPSAKSPTVNDSQSSSTPLDDDDDDVVGKIPEGHISTWSSADVVEFVSPRDCKKFADVFLEQVRMLIEMKPG